MFTPVQEKIREAVADLALASLGRDANHILRCVIRVVDSCRSEKSFDADFIVTLLVVAHQDRLPSDLPEFGNTSMLFGQDTVPKGAHLKRNTSFMRPVFLHHKGDWRQKLNAFLTNLASPVNFVKPEIQLESTQNEAGGLVCVASDGLDFHRDYYMLVKGRTLEETLSCSFVDMEQGVLPSRAIVCSTLSELQSGTRT